MLFAAFLSFFVLPWLSPLWVINVIIISSPRPRLGIEPRKSRQAGGGGVYLESYTCEARFLTRWDQHAVVCVGGGGGGGGGGVYLESYTREERFLEGGGGGGVYLQGGGVYFVLSLLRIVHARGAIPNEMGPTRCRATQAFKPISRRDPHPGLPVPAVDLSLPFAPSWTWCLGGQTVTPWLSGGGE